MAFIEAHPALLAIADVDAAPEEEWEVLYQLPCRLTHTVHIYLYHNQSLNMSAVMWCAEEDGRVLFQRQDGCTGWHGTWNFNEGGTLLGFRFDYQGRTHRTKTVRLLLESRDVWTGYDYAGRRVRATFRETKRWCTTCEVWHTQ